MKILYLCPDLGIPVLGRKGASVHVRQLIGALGRAGHRLTLAAQVLNKSPWEKPAVLDIPIVQVRTSSATTTAVQALKEFNNLLGTENSFPGELRRILYNKELVDELKRRFEADPPDFIYERASLYATAGVALARQLRVPILMELNAPLAVEQTAYRATGFGRLAAQAEQWTLTQADALLVVSADLRNHAISLGVAPERIHVLPNGVDPALFRPGKADATIRRRLKLGRGPVLGFVGGLRPWHGVEALPALLGRLSKRYPELKLVIAGDGQLRRDLEESLEKRGLLKRARFTGMLEHEEIPRVMRQFTIALAPYPKHDHAFYFSPLKVFEYMACGLPVVAPEVGQIAEVIRHGKTGLLYPAGDLEALAERCDDLLQRPRLRSILAKNAASLIRKHFTWDHNARRITELVRLLQKQR